MIEIKVPEKKEEVKGDLISRQAVIYYIKPYIQEIITESGVDKNERTNRILRAIINGIETMPAGKEEPAEDCISREAVDEYITNLLSGYLYDEERTRLEDLSAFVWELPSVTPQPKKGHWIFDEIIDKHYYCSECKSMGVDYWDYCPNCGAKMEEEDNNAVDN